MLTQAFDRLSPVLRSRYEQLLRRELAASPELADLHEDYLDYALRDHYLPRPVLTYFGYHARVDDVAFDDVERIGDGLLSPQLLRDFLAIHDDIVDEDLEKLGKPPLPVVLSTRHSGGAQLAKAGKDLALYYGDFLMGVLLRVVAAVEPPTRSATLTRLVADTLYVSQRGQLAELMAEDKPLDQVTVDDLLTIYEHKAAYYCYSFPFEVGVRLAGHSPDIAEAVRPVLLRIGAMSQIIDDLTGAFPGIVDHDKDTLGELVHLRRTVLLVLLAQQDLSDTVRALLAAQPPLLRADAEHLRAELWSSPVPVLALQLCEELLSDIRPRASRLPLGAAASEYLDDLIEHRLEGSVARLRSALNVAEGSCSPG
ncbi:MAG: polyprenyl synthetase family protein [Egibacteraceae bacterium]